MSMFKKELAVNSLVRVFRDDNATGMGFYARGDYIVTATHCLPYIPDRDQPGDDPVKVRVETLVGGRAATAFVTGADVCLDVAMLSNRTLKGHDLPPDWQQTYAQACRELNPAPLLLEDLPVGTEVDVHLYSHEGKWLQGKADIYAAEHPLCGVQLTTQRARIKPGTSGTPVFTTDGHVLGIISMADTDSGDEHSVDAIRLAKALPGWALCEATNCQRG